MSKIKDIKFDIKFKYHFWFWTIYFILNFLRWGAYFNDYGYSFNSNLIEFSIHIPLVYLNLFYLVPRFVLKGKHITYVTLLLVSLFVVYLLKTGLTYSLISSNIWPEANREYKPFEINHIIAVCIGELYVLAMASSIYLTLIWLKERERNRILREEQFKIKLKYLRNQIQPHFFFNTLNNLYALSLEKSDKVPDVILKLSSLMEYVLYGIEKENYALLINEINYIQNYIEIEKLRFENTEVSININSNIDNVKVPPLLLITLLENAFKHGGYNNKSLTIRINFQIIEGNILDFVVINNFVHSQNIKPTNGIGLANTRKRLKLIFKNNYILEQKIKFNYHIVNLQIPLQK